VMSGEMQQAQSKGRGRFAIRSPSLAYVATHIEDDYMVSESSTIAEVDENDADQCTDTDREPTESWKEVTLMVILFVVLGASGWWSNNTINNENPVFINQTPEGNRFPTLGSFACQIGNVFPIIYKSVTGFCLYEHTRRRIVAPTVYIGLLSGAVVLAVCAFFWKSKLSVAGEQYSGVLLLCCVISGGIGCMSNVTYWAFASRYPVYCTKAMSTGMTFGGLLGSAIILGQNAGCNPTFSVEFYFLAGVAIQLVMLVGTLPILRFSEEQTQLGSKELAKEMTTTDTETGENTPLLTDSKELRINDECEGVNIDVLERKTRSVSQPSYIDRDGFVLCCLCFCVYGMTYALAPMMPYVLEGYDIVTPHAKNSTGYALDAPIALSHEMVPHMLYSEMGGVTDVYTMKQSWNSTRKSSKCNASTSSQRDGIYRWALVCQQVGDVSGRISTAFGTPKNLRTLLTLGLSAMMIFIFFCVATAMSSSVPLWLPNDFGYVIPALLLLYYFLRGFCVTSCYVWVKENMSKRDAERLSSNLGMLGQMGALSGNILMVLLTYFVLEPP